MTTVEDQDVMEKLSSIKEKSEFELTEKHKNILDQRLKYFEGNPPISSSWEEVKSRLSAK